MPNQEAESLAAVLSDQAVRAPRQPWLEAARSDQVVDRAELAAIAALWRAQGLAGRRVGLLTGDPVAFGALFVSLIAAGATVVPLDPNAPVRSVQEVVAASKATALVTTGAGAPLGGVDLVVRASSSTLLPEPSQPAGRGAPSGVTAGGGGCVLFSSGSTGPRKAVRLAEDQMLHVARAVARAQELGPEDRGFNPLPLAHVNAEVVGLLAPLVSGGTVVLDGRFYRTGFWQLIAQRSVTWVNAVPAIIAILAQEPPQPTVAPPPALRFVRSASAPLPVAVLARFEERYHVPVVESYGMTEAASQITANPLRQRRPGTVGLPVDVELRVVDDAGAVASPGQVGRVLIRGRGVIRRYENGVGEDRFDVDGWLDTGDLGAQDHDGFLTLVGREGEVVNRGGEKVFPREVEEVLRGHPAVKEAVVFGRREAVLGAVPVAYVVPFTDGPLDLEEQLTARCAAALPRSHCPAEIRLVTELPHGPTGKPARRLVAALDQECLAYGAVDR